MSLSKVQVISNALTLLGKKPILSLDGQGDLVVAAEQAFDFLYPAALCNNQWRFAAKIIQLSQLPVAPYPQTMVSFSYAFAYQLPVSFLKGIRLWPQSYDWEIFEAYTLLTNVGGPLYFEYTHQVTEGFVPMYFWKYFVYELAAYLALSSAQQPEYFSALEGKRSIEWGIACAADACNRPQTPLVSVPMITARTISTHYGG